MPYLSFNIYIVAGHKRKNRLHMHHSHSLVLVDLLTFYIFFPVHFCKRFKTLPYIYQVKDFVAQWVLVRGSWFGSASLHSEKFTSSREAHSSTFFHGINLLIGQLLQC
jgi:hypothetical protein